MPQQLENKGIKPTGIYLAYFIVVKSSIEEIK